MIIYKITNNINEKLYIGQTTVSVCKRWQRHCWASEYKKNMPISLAIAKYGKENFAIEILDTCNNQVELDEQEIYYAKLYNTFCPNGYNLRAGSGPGSMSEETKRKISLANKGKKRSEETRRKLSESHKGYKHKESTKQKLSDLNRGKIPPKQVREASIRSSQKSYLITHPDGSTENIVNMRKFCRIHNLSPSKMCLVAQGKRSQHKGFMTNYLPTS